MKTVIKGAYYYDEDSDTILMPHFSGQFNIVDCSSFITMDKLKENFGENYVNKVKDNPIHLDGKCYYSSEFSPYCVNDWELLSDISELTFVEDTYDF